MIARLWHGYTKPDNAGTYHNLLLTSILPAIHRIAGYKGSYVLRKDGADEVEFITITFWESLDAIREFAGADYETAVVPADRRKFLAHYDPKSAHYEVILHP